MKESDEPDTEKRFSLKTESEMERPWKETKPAEGLVE